MSRERYQTGSAALARPSLPGITAGPNRHLFVVGASSGTTLLQRMLDVHPLLAVVNETPGGSPATPALLAHVDEVRSAFTANLRASDRPLPRNWAA